MVSPSGFKIRDEIIFNNFNIFNNNNIINLNIKNVIFKYNYCVNTSNFLKKNKAYPIKLRSLYNSLTFNNLDNVIQHNNNIFIISNSIIKYIPFYKQVHRLGQYNSSLFISRRLCFSSSFFSLKFFNFNVIKTLKQSPTLNKTKIIELKCIFVFLLKHYFYTLFNFYKKIYSKNFLNHMFSNNLFFFQNFSFLLTKLMEKYQKFFNFFKFIKINLIFKNYAIFNKIILYLIKFNKILLKKIFNKNLLNIFIDNQIFNKFSYLYESKFGLNVIFKNIVKLYKIIFFVNIFINFFFNKFQNFKIKFLTKNYRKFFKFHDYLKYTKIVSLKNYNFLILTLLMKSKIDLKNYFYYIFYRYNYKDQKNFFDLYNYIYKIYNKNNFLNQF